MDNGFTPRERGLVIGHDWARTVANVDELRRAANEDAIPPDVWFSLMEYGMADPIAADPATHAEFRAGFVRGVRGWIAELTRGLSPN